MDEKKQKRQKCPRSTPYVKNKLKAKLSAMSSDDEILNIHTDTDNELINSGSESTCNGKLTRNDSIGPTSSIVESAKSEMMILLKEIRNSQSTQCTKKDLIEYSQTINKQFVAMDQRVSSNTSTMKSIESRVEKIESAMESNKHESELAKQNVLSCNLSIIGIPAASNEDLKMIALRIFSFVGCQLTPADIFSFYRIKKGKEFTSIFSETKRLQCQATGTKS